MDMNRNDIGVVWVFAFHIAKIIAFVFILFMSGRFWAFHFVALGFVSTRLGFVLILGGVLFTFIKIY